MLNPERLSEEAHESPDQVKARTEAELEALGAHVRESARYAEMLRQLLPELDQ